LTAKQVSIIPSKSFAGFTASQITALSNSVQVPPSCSGILEYQLANSENTKKINLGLTEELINKAITQHELKLCRQECDKTYKVNYPLKLPPPPRDKFLGTSPDNAALSCSDILKWGSKDTKSGEYWVKLKNKSKSKVFCDMETDKGGWTLFFNYIHYPGQEVSISSSTLPFGLKSNSHINLKEVGIEEKDIEDIRFFCTERQETGKFIHFKTSDSDILNLALTGDQRNLNINSFKNSYSDLSFPLENDKNYWKRAMDKEDFQHLDYVNKSNNGFWDTPFGLKRKRKYWTVKGNSLKGGRFECGSDYEDDNSSSVILTHHTVWFRGYVMSLEAARNRFLNRLNKKLAINN